MLERSEQLLKRASACGAGETTEETTLSVSCGHACNGKVGRLRAAASRYSRRLEHGCTTEDGQAAASADVHVDVGGRAGGAGCSARACCLRHSRLASTVDSIDGLELTTVTMTEQRVHVAQLPELHAKALHAGSGGGGVASDAQGDGGDGGSGASDAQGDFAGGEGEAGREAIGGSGATCRCLTVSAA